MEIEAISLPRIFDMKYLKNKEPADTPHNTYNLQWIFVVSLRVKLPIPPTWNQDPLVSASLLGPSLLFGAMPC